MEVLVLDGKNYVKASKAARDLGYATDYVGQLCRTGQVDAHLIGRTWYVNPEELGTHRIEKKRMSRAKAREQAKRLIVAQRATAGSLKSQSGSRNIAISYETDEGPLIPETRKLQIRPEPTQVHTDEEIAETTIENSGAKIRMSGDLTVVDVTDGPVDEFVTVLSPKLMRSRPHTEAKQVDETQEERHIAIETEVSEHIEPAIEFQPQKTFTERLQKLESAQTVPVPMPAEIPMDAPSSGQNVEKGSFFMHFLFQIMILLGVLASFGLYSEITYDTSRIEIFRSQWVFSIEDALAELSEHILSN